MYENVGLPHSVQHGIGLLGKVYEVCFVAVHGLHAQRDSPFGCVARDVLQHPRNIFEFLLLGWSAGESSQVRVEHAAEHRSLQTSSDVHRTLQERLRLLRRRGQVRRLRQSERAGASDAVPIQQRAGGGDVHALGPQ